MATKSCTKPLKDCKSCGHYRFDPDRMDYMCHRQDDLRKKNAVLSSSIPKLRVN